MTKSIFAAALLAAPALVSATGSAIVINSCSYDVFLANTPASGGGQSTVSQTLSSGGSYSQEYTELSNGNGWSLKLCKDDTLSNIMQYEYTYHDDGIIWYDLSDVNGNPWDGNWEITATGDCTPRQAAYRFATDDAYGMQSCPDSSSITVTLCSGDSAGGSPAGSSPVQSAYSVATSEATSVVSPTPSPTTTYGGIGNNIVQSAPKPSTLATENIRRLGAHRPHTVVNVHTVYETKYVVPSPAPKHKRHNHAAAHAHA